MPKGRATTIMCAPPPCYMGLFCSKAVLIAILLLLQCTSFSFSAKSETEILMKFKSSLGHRVRLTSWNPKKPPCVQAKPNWVGVLCNGKGNVWGLKLENMGLFGTIDVDSLQELVNLRTISFINNKFNATFPKLNKLVELKSIYFSGNRFSGEIDPNAFQAMHELKKVHMSNNQLSGSIPSSLATLEKLVELYLDGNKFSGEIPDFKLGTLKDLNVSNNKLQGPIPPSLSNMKPSSFSGNGNLCGEPLETLCPSSPTPQPAQTSTSTTTSSSSSSSGISVKTIIGIIAGVIALIVFVIITVALCKRGRKSQTGTAVAMVPLPHGGKRDLDNMEKGSSPNLGPSTKKGESGTKMTFLRDDIEKFELGDLLKASAEVLGSGHFGASYKAALTTGKKMVVKRFRHMNNVGREEFQEHMRRLGRLSHPNLLPIVAFYYRKEEKLLVADYIDNVNLAVHLHGNRSRGYPSPDWPKRLSIIKGVARGLQYLYSELPSLMLPHGHLKSSNVLLTPSLEPLLTDYALIPVVNQEHAQDVMVAYKSPEYKHGGRVTKKTDVWSFGVLILEILTGRFPSNFLQQGKGGETDLVNWVESIMNQAGGDSDLFDKEMGEVVKGTDGQMVKLLKIGLACAENDVDKRLDLKEAVSRIEEVKENDNPSDEEFFSVATSDGERF